MAFIAILLSAALVAIAVVSFRYQLRTWRRLRGGEAIASDDRRYLRGVCQRRTFNAVLIVLLAGMLAGAFLSGGVGELERIARLGQQDPPEKPTDEDREVVKGWAIYWIAVLVLLFFVLAVAFADYTATSLYARQQLRRIRNEQQVLLERDLAVYRQQKLNNRMRGQRQPP
jgi:hypothetical protein